MPCLREGQQIAPALGHVGHAVPVLIPLALPVLRQEILPVIQHGRLNVHRHAAVVFRPFDGGGIGVPGGLGDLVIAFQLLNGERIDVLAFGVLHDDVVCLIQHVRAVAVRAIVGKIQILVHVGVYRHDAVVRIGLVKGVDQLGEVPLCDNGVVFQHPDGDVLLQLSVKDGVLHRGRGSGVWGLLAGPAALTVSAPAAGEQARYHGQRQHQGQPFSFHLTSSS